MRFSTTIRYALAKWAMKGVSWAYTPSWVRSSVLSPAWSSLVSKGYRSAAAYFACVETHAFTFPEAPLWVWDGEGDDARPLPDHPVRRLLSMPNADQDEGDFKADVITWLAIGGNAYLHKLRNRRGVVIGLRAYHDGVIQAVPVGDADGVDDGTGSLVSHYTFRQVDGTLVPLPKADVIHLKWPAPDPDAPWRGQAPIVAAAYDVGAVSEATRMVWTLLSNDATPRTVLTPGPQQALTPDEARRMREQFQQQHGGQNVGGVAVLESGMTIQRLGLSMNELDFAALHDIPVKQICAVMKVPPPVAGLGDDPTYANSEEASRRFTTDTRVPLWRRFESAIMRGLADELAGGVARHYLGRVAALQENENERAARVYQGWTARLLGFKEARAQLGIMDDPDPNDFFLVSMTSDMVRWRELVAPPPPPALPPPAPTVTVIPPAQLTDAKGATPPLPVTPAPRPVAGRKDAARYVSALRRVRASVAARMERAVSAAFEDLAEQVTARFTDLEKQHGTAAATKALPGLDQLLIPDDAAILAGIFRAWTLTVAAESWELMNQALDIELAFDASDPAVVAALAQSGDRIVGITDTTRQAVRDLLQYGASQGWSIQQFVTGDETQPGLRATVAQTYRNRARTIARTEVAMGQQAVTHARYEAAGVRWVTVLDGGGEDSDDICTQLNGSVKPLAWAKENPLQHPNCVRAFAPNLDGPATEDA